MRGLSFLPPLLTALLILGGGAGAAGAAAGSAAEGARPAQASAPLSLRGELERLGRELETARIELAQAGDSPASVAALQARLIQLEEELRDLTGRLERVEFEQRQAAERIDRLVADVDNRLRRIEAQIDGDGDGDGGTGASAGDPPESAGRDLPVIAAPGAAGDGAPDEAAAAGGDERQSAETEAAIEADRAAREGYVLGTIPRDALLGIDRPDDGNGDDAGEAGEAVEVPQAALEGSASERFAAGLSLLQTGNWAAAEAAFGRFVEDFPDAEETPSAAFWIGESHFFREDYAEAAAAFARNYRTYGADAPRAADNLLKLGMSLARLGDTERACQTFAELDRRYPDAAAPIRQALARERDDAGCE